MLQISFFSGPIPAQKEIWIFADQLLNQTQGWLKKLEFEYLKDGRIPQLYLYEKYFIRTYPQDENSIYKHNFIAEIRNQIANTTMRKVLLPSAVLILISNEKLEDAVFTIECMEGLLCWLFDEIHEIIRYQLSCLPQKSKNFEEPRVYILKALPKPTKAKNLNLFKGVRRKFNQTLQSILEDYHNFGFINVHEITTREKDEKFFISQYDG